MSLGCRVKQGVILADRNWTLKKRKGTAASSGIGVTLDLMKMNVKTFDRLMALKRIQGFSKKKADSKRQKQVGRFVSLFGPISLRA